MFRRLIIITVLATMVASRTFAFASNVTDDAKTCAAAVDRPQQLHVRLAAASQFDEAVVAQARTEVETIWRRYQIDIVWSDDTGETRAAKPDLAVEFVSTLSTHNVNAIAWVLFNAGRPLPLARVSIPAANRLFATAKSWFNGRSLADSAVVVRNMALGRIIGRALAHEIGHFLLASPRHTRDGLMRAAIDAEQFVQPSLGLFRLGDQELRTLRAARTADCELTREIATTAP